MEPRILRVERVFPISFLQGHGYSWFENLFDALVEEMKMRIGSCFIDKQATFVMNRELYRLFYSVAPMIKGPYWNGIYVKEDLTPEYITNPWSTDEKRKGRIILEYREPVYIPFELTERRTTMPPKGDLFNPFKPYELYFAIPRDLEIEKVIFNHPATIVFWNDGTKTVVKAQEGDGWDMEKGLAMCIAKKMLGLKKFYKAFNQGVNDYWGENELGREEYYKKFNKEK